MQEIFLPDPFVIHFHYNSGSAPPPNHYEYVIHIGPGPANKVIYLPDYPGESTPQWEHSFTVEKEALQKLYKLMLEKQLMLCRWHPVAAQPTGGSQEWAEITCNRILVKVPANLPEEESRIIAPVYQAIRSLVPDEIWHDLAEKRKQYILARGQHE